MIMFDFKNKINKNNNENDLYDLSVLSSIIGSIDALISNTDYQYKRISILFPNLIKKNPPSLLLFTNNTKDKYVEMFEQMKDAHNEYKYKVINCDKIGSRINCGKIVDKNLSIKIEKLPSLYLLTDDNILDIPITKFNHYQELEKFIS